MSPARGGLGRWIGPALVSLLLGASASCGSEAEGPSHTPRARGSAVVGGEVLSTVDGYPITRAEVEHAARAANVTPSTALARLEDEAVLALAAERAGAGEDPRIAHAQRQAMVQALLARTVEVERVEIDPAEVEAAYEANPARFSAPEQRRSAHVVARVEPGADDSAQQAWIAEVLAELQAAPDPLAATLAIDRRPLHELPFEVMVQEVAGMARDAPADPAYLEALFAMSAPGVVPTPVRTEMGWHVIVLTRIEPERATSRMEALETLRSEREASLRYEILNRITMELARASNVHIEPNAADLLGNPRVLGPAR